MESKYLLERRAKLFGKPIAEKIVPHETKKVKKKSLKKATKKRAKQLRKYSVNRKEFLKQNPTCQLKLKGCTAKTTEVHHIEGRENDLLNKTESFMALCHNCHVQVTEKLSYSESKKIGAKK